MGELVACSLYLSIPLNSSLHILLTIWLWGLALLRTDRKPKYMYVYHLTQIHTEPKDFE